MHDIEKARQLTERAHALTASGSWTEAIACFKEAIRILEEGNKRGERAELAQLYVKKGAALESSGKGSEAIGSYGDAEHIYRQMAHEGMHDEVCQELGLAIMASGVLLEKFGEKEIAFSHYNEGCTLLEDAVGKGLHNVLPAFLKARAIRMESMARDDSSYEVAGDLLHAVKHVEPLLESRSLSGQAFEGWISLLRIVRGMSDRTRQAVQREILSQVRYHPELQCAGDLSVRLLQDKRMWESDWWR